MNLNPMNDSDEARLIAELKATFPGIHARPLADYRPTLGRGAWIGGDAVAMPDGLPMFTDVLGDTDEYDGFVHQALCAWLDLRGWYIESVDPFTHLVIPDPVIARSVEQMHHAWFYKPRAPLPPGELPF